jgi:hypothetical protein
MDLLSPVSNAAITLAAGTDPATTTAGPVPGRLATGKTTAAGKSASAGRSASAAKTASGSAARKTGASAAKATTTTSKTKAAASGYSKAAASDAFAFLKDSTLSVEEKLFRFMCAITKLNDDEVLKKMNEMKGGAAKATSGTSSSSGSSSAKKTGTTSVWNALKALIPPLGMAAQLVGDAKLKSMITQMSGPVLAAAATAMGMPALAPLALQAGPDLVSAIINGKLGGGEAARAVLGERLAGKRVLGHGGAPPSR